MKGNNFTDKAHWEEYWKNYRYDKVPRKVVFDKFVPKLATGNTLIEIGGFPGVFSAYFYRQGIRDVTILDFYINTGIVQKFEQINDLPEGSIQCIDSDFFAFTTGKRYDVVFSSGFIEHFEDTRDVIRRHVEEIMQSFGLSEISVDYIGKPMVWLEPKPENQNKRKWVKILSYAIKLIPVKSKFLSPYIAIYAIK